ncbi:MAG: hypothetical protein LRY73_02070 [Bacillus sp. (in: Bacteria)]|nr:hypothetical protein [Bacillus sp. (in: firmicutes)]
MLTSYLKELRQDFDRLGNSIVRLPDALETINMAQGEFRTLFSDRFEELKEFNREFNSHLKNHAAESSALEKHLNSTTHSYEQMSMKNSQLLNEINRTVTQITDSFQHRENQMDASVGVLKDTLARYVASLEGTLGDSSIKSAVVLASM